MGQFTRQDAIERDACFSSSMNGILVIDTLGRITRCGSCALKLLEREESEVYLEKAARILPEFQLDEMLAPGFEQSIGHVSYKGKTYICNRIPLKDRNQVRGGLAIIQDSERDQDLVRKLDAIIESSYDGIYITDGDANTLMVNKSYEILTGLNRKDLIGHNMKELVSNRVMSKSATLMVLKNKKTVTIEQEFMTGKRVMVTSTPILDAAGRVDMVVTNVRDITSLAKLQDQLEHSQELAGRYMAEVEEMRLQLFNTTDIIANDERMLDTLRLAKRVAEVDTTVLLTGETGVGKEEIAKFIHKNSPRLQKVFLKVNCGAIPGTLIESELFGYEKGAFTGANATGKKGMFEYADGGTIFLDEVSELPLDMQVKLLRVLQEQEFTRVGGRESIKVDVRIIAATNRPLEDLVKAQVFREDLYYRLNVVPLTILPLRERRDDILPLVQQFMARLNEKYHLEKSFSKDALATLYEHEWPGNVRELKNIVERVVLMSEHEVITNPVLHKILKAGGTSFENGKDGSIPKLKEAVESLELELLDRAYSKYGNVRDAAKALGVDPSTFVRKRQRCTKAT